MEDHVKKVKVTATVEGPLSVQGSSTQTIDFAQLGDKMVNFDLKVGNTLGIAKVKVVAEGNGERAEQDIEIDVRYPGSRQTVVVGDAIDAGADWSSAVNLIGLEGTNKTSLEVSRMPPLDLDDNLASLIRYPHGCIEQTTSSVFPQLYLPALVELSADQQDDVKDNISAALRKLTQFQTTSGGFAYWPGRLNASDWGTNYAGNFLIEAERAGYRLPSSMRDNWIAYQSTKAQRFSDGGPTSQLAQAYRLYTLALAGAPELGAMNRLKASKISIAAKWRLAAAYQLAGQSAVASEIVKGVGVSVPTYVELNGNFGSSLRDEAMILEALTLMDDRVQAAKVAKSVSEQLSQGRHATQTTAYSLLALAKFAEVAGAGSSTDFSWTLDGQAHQVSTDKALAQIALPVDFGSASNVSIKNTSGGVLFTRLITSGLPALGDEIAEKNGLSVEVKYTTPQGRSIVSSKVTQGDDFKATIKVQNTTGRRLEQLALSEIVASGWEIYGTSSGSGRGYDYRDVRDDRVYTYFSLPAGKTVTFEVGLHASYLGHYYLAPVSVEAMYDADINGRTKGRWVDVVPAGGAD